MRRKIRALAAEGRTSALILASLPFFIFAAVHLFAEFLRCGLAPRLTKRCFLGLDVDESWTCRYVSNGKFQDLSRKLDHG